MVIIGGVTARAAPVALYRTSPPRNSSGRALSGDDAVTLEQSVATPIEEQMTRVDKMPTVLAQPGLQQRDELRVAFDITTEPA